jgi:hypothetical protein
VAGLAALAIVGCSADSRSGREAPPRAQTSSDEPPRQSAANAYIGSVAVDPADGTLLLGTGLGLYRYEPRSGAVSRVVGVMKVGQALGTLSSNMVVRFARSGQLLASGHPEHGTLPENLGLIQSTDEGRTWRPIALFGDADFHVLQVAGDRLVAVGAEEDRIRISTDGGRSFASRAAPGVPVDVVFDPGEPARMVASTEQGLFTSPDEGHGWRPVDPTGAASQLTWVASTRLFRADPDGVVRLSRDGGRSWQGRGSAGGDVHELVGDAGGILYASVPGGEVKVSDDQGVTWRRLVRLR